MWCVISRQIGKYFVHSKKCVETLLHKFKSKIKCFRKKMKKQWKLNLYIEVMEIELEKCQ